MNRDEFIAQTVDWLNRRVAPEGVTIDADTRLFESGLIDSLAVLRLIAWTERAIGRVIQDREIRMDRFGSVRDMAFHFVEADAASLAGGGCAAGRGVAAGGSAASGAGSAASGAGSAASGTGCSRCGVCSRRAA